MSSVRIEKLAVGGDGLGRLATGQHVFVRGSLPGDIVSVQEARKQRGAQRAIRWSLEQPGPDRVAPACPVAAECGGCNWMALSQAAQAEHKLGIFLSEVGRAVSLAYLDRPPRLIPGGPALGYRRKLRLKIACGKVGFLKPGSHELVEPERCLVASPAINHGLDRLRELTRHAPSTLDAFDCVEVEEHAFGAWLVFHLASQHAFLPLESEALLRRLRAELGVALAGQSPPSQWPRTQITSDTYGYVPPGTFMQVNQVVNRQLVEGVLDAARGARTFCDLYCGSGNFSLPLARAGLSGTGVEAHALGVEAARLAAREQGLESLGFIVSDSALAARRLRREGHRFDLIVADPPRAGIKKGLADVAWLAKKSIVMCSCDVGTFTRDLQRLCEVGFSLKRLDAFDMFPQTHHVEGFARLVRTEPAST